MYMQINDRTLTSAVGHEKQIQPSNLSTHDFEINLSSLIIFFKHTMCILD